MSPVKIRRIGHSIWPAILLGVSSYNPLDVFAQEQTPQTTVQKPDPQAGPLESAEIIEQLREAIERADLGKASELRQMLGQQGDPAVAAIEKALKDQAFLRLALINTLPKIDGDASTTVLMRLLRQELLRENSFSVIPHLEQRSLNRPLSKEELDVLASQILKEDVLHAGMLARLLSRASHNDVQVRAIPIIQRLKREIAEPSPVGQIHGTYVSGEVFAVNQFLLALSQIDDPRVLSLLKQEMQEDNHPKLTKGIVIARGYLGDETVATILRKMLTEEKDASSRISLIRAYARSAKHDAIPLLQTFLNDKTVTGQGSRGPFYGLRIAAQGEITRLNTK